MSDTSRSFHLDSLVPVMHPFCLNPAARKVIFSACDSALDELTQLNRTVQIPGDWKPPHLTIERVNDLNKLRTWRTMRAYKYPRHGRKIEAFLRFSAEWAIDLSEWIPTDYE